MTRLIASIFAVVASLFCLMAQGQTNVALTGADRLLFRSGDHLNGSLQGIDADGKLKWLHPGALAPMDFALDQLASLELAQTNQALVTTGLVTRIYLTSGEMFEARGVTADASRILADTAFAGLLTVPRSAVAALAPIPAMSKTLYSGPDGLEGWTMGKVQTAVAVGESGEWKYRNGAFLANRSASIARVVGLPDSGSIQFDLAWKGYFHLAVALATDYLQPVNLANKDNEGDFGGFYSLQINGFTANLLPVRKGEPIRYLGQAALTSLNQKTSAHFEIRYHKAKRLVALLVDGVLVKQWIDSEDFAGTGRGLRFVHQGQGSVRLSELKVLEWDGQFEEGYKRTYGLKEDRVKFRNGDRTVGTFVSLSGEQMVMSTTAREVKAPWGRVALAEFTDASLKQPTMDGLVIARFGGGSRLRFKVESWTPNEMVATHPLMGKLRISPRGVASLNWVERVVDGVFGQDEQ